MTAIYQLIHTLSYGDAISTEALTIKKALEDKGIDSKIFAINVHPRYKDKALSYKELTNYNPDKIILHYSIGSVLNEIYLKLSCEKIVIYHNITPAIWFKNVNPKVAEDITQGIKDLKVILNASDKIIADSKFNAQQISTPNLNVSVLPLPIPDIRWNVLPNKGIINTLSSQSNQNILHVGRLAPNKKIEDIIKIFYFYHHYSNKNSKLWLVGIDADTEIYSYALKRLVLELKLEDAVCFTGCLDDSELKAMYLSCQLYICMSEHEGFCLPLIEAMHFGLPIIAYDSCAVGETLNGCGILVKDKDFCFLGKLIDELLNNTSLKEKLILAGKTQAENLNQENFNNNLYRLLF